MGRQIISTLKSDLQSARHHISGIQSPIIRINQITPEIKENPFSLDSSLSNSDYSKSEEIISKNNGKVHLRLLDKLEKYITYKHDNNGIIIDSFMDNQFGKLLQTNGIKIGWKLTKIGNIDTIQKQLVDIKEICYKNTVQSIKTSPISTPIDAGSYSLSLSPT